MQRLCLLWTLSILLMGLTAALPAHAVDYTFDGGAAQDTPPGDSQLWADARNWSPDGIPGAGDSVTIGTGNFPVVNLPSSVTVARLNLGGATLNGGVLTVTQSATVAQSL